MASKSDQIRQLSAEGLSVSDIARRLGIRYQHAYNVLRANTPPTATPVAATEIPPTPRATKPTLTVAAIVTAGFKLSAHWGLTETGGLAIAPRLPSAPGVYAFAKDGIVLYVGVATMGLAKRVYFYGKPGVTQQTSLRINATIVEELGAGAGIEIYTAVPPDLEWNGLPVSGVAGLEYGLIRRYHLPWNIRSAR